MASITLNVVVTKTAVRTYNLTITASNQMALGDNAIFAIQVMPLQSELSEPTTRFSHVCDYQDMQDYGTQLDRSLPYYRQDSVTLILRSRALVAQVIDSIKSETNKLIAEITSISEDLSPQTQFSDTIVISD